LIEKQFSNLINTRFSQWQNINQLTLALWQWHISIVCCLFIYLLINYWTLHRGKTCQFFTQWANYLSHWVTSFHH